jgi:cation diffusion facilitator family transporter
MSFVQTAQRIPPHALLRVSIVVAAVTIALKTLAWWLTGSVGLLSDALESTVNLVAAAGALVALRVSIRPADEEHAYGHAKAEYFAAGAEGMMILLAAGSIAVAAIERLLRPSPLDSLGVGLLITVGASLVNLAVALVLRRAGRANRSITLEADGTHLLTDVWTSAGVVVGVGLVAVTGWQRLDPIVALAVAVNIVVAGVGLIRRSGRGLMDASLPASQLRLVDEVLARFTTLDTQFHGVRTRQAGRRAFMSMHMLVPGSWSVQRSHDLAEQVERALREAVPGLGPTIHVEPLEDPRSFADVDLDPHGVPPSARPGGPG